MADQLLHSIEEPQSRLLTPSSEPEAEEKQEESEFIYEGPSRETVMNLRKAYLRFEERTTFY